MKGRLVKWQSAAKKKPKMSRYLSENTKTGDFNPQRTLSGSFFAIPERFCVNSFRSLAFTANKQTNILNYNNIMITSFTLARKSLMKPADFSGYCQ